jgi:hypothetical protein
MTAEGISVVDVGNTLAAARVGRGKEPLSLDPLPGVPDALERLLPWAWKAERLAAAVHT